MIAPGFAVWRAARDELHAALAAASARWGAIPGSGSGPMGITPDHIKRSPEWQESHAAYWRAHRALAAHNREGMRHYRREIAADARAAREGGAR